MSMIPGNLLDEQYDTQAPVSPTPTTGEKWGAVYDQAVAKMPTVGVYNALKNISDQPEIPAADLNKQFPDNPKPFTKSLPYETAKSVYNDTIAQVKRQEIIHQAEWSPLEQAGKTAVDWLSPIADPIMAASFLVTGPIAEFGAPLVKGAASLFGEGILARAVEIGLSGATHATLAAVPLEAASKFTTEAEGQKFTNEQLVSESANLIGGVVLFGGAIGLGIGALEKMAGKAKLAEKVFSSLKPNEKEVLIQNQASLATGKGQLETSVLGLTDTLATHEAKLGIEAKTGEHQAELIDKLEFKHDEAMSDAMAQKAFATKELNSLEMRQIAHASGDEELKILAEQKENSEKQVLDTLFEGKKLEDIAAENDGNFLVERYLANNYPDEMFQKWTQAKEEAFLAEAQTKDPNLLFSQFLEQRKQQVKEIQTNRLEALRESARNGTLNPVEESSGIPKDHVSEPSVPANEALDHQISQIDEMQKSIDEEANRGKTEEPLKEGEQKELSPAEEEDLRNEGKFQDIRKVLDCFMKN